MCVSGEDRTRNLSIESRMIYHYATGHHSEQHSEIVTLLKPEISYLYKNCRKVVC